MGDQERERDEPTSPSSTSGMKKESTSESLEDFPCREALGATTVSRHQCLTRSEKLTYEKIFYRERQLRRGGVSDLRIPDHPRPMVQRVSQEGCPQEITGFPTRWSQYCTGELKRNSLRRFMASQSQSGEGTGALLSKQEFSSSALKRGANINIVQYLGIAVDEPERIARHTKPGFLLPLVEVGWDEAYCRQWCEERDLLSPIYTTATRGGCWFCHNQGVDQLRLLRKNYPDLWSLLMKWDSDSPVTFHADGHTVHDFDRRFQLEDEGKIPIDRRFRWKMLEQLNSENCSE